MTNVAQLVGLPWQAGASGPASFDCYGLVRYVLEARGQRLPELPFSGETLADASLGQNALSSGRCVALSKPAPWCLVLMGRAMPLSPPMFTHVGLWLPQGGVLHCQRSVGVVTSRLAELGALGFTAHAFYAYLSPAP